MSGTARKLNVGCGLDIRSAADGWVNLDVAALPGVDVVHDIFTLPWPFKDGEFDALYAAHILEHVPHSLPGVTKDGFVAILEEMWRILKPGGLLQIRVPHYLGDYAIHDPTHTRLVHPRNFDYFSPDTEYGRKYGHYTVARFRLESEQVTDWLPRWPNFLRVGRSRLPLALHLAVRFPWLRWLVARAPAELMMVLRREPSP